MSLLQKMKDQVGHIGVALQGLLGDAEFLKGTNGAAHVNPIPGTQEQLRARFADAVPLVPASFKAVDWPSNANITELVVFCTPSTPEVAQTGDYGIIAIDAPIGSEASYLTQTESLSSDIQWIPIPPNEIIRIPLTEALSEGQFSGGQVACLSVGVAMDFVIIGS